MKNSTLTPEESLLLITKTIEETKTRFKENGHMFLFWGILMLVITLSQYILLRLEQNKIIDWEYTVHNWPVFLYPLVGGVYVGIYTRKVYKKKKLPKTIIGNLIGTLGWVMGVNFMILGFFYYAKLGEALVPMFLILLAMFIIVCGLSIKFKPITIGGILLNLIGFATFYFDWQYHTLLMSLGAVVGLIIPGILLNIARRKNHV